MSTLALLFMVTVNLGTSQMEAPFCVFNRTKLKDAKRGRGHEERTNAWKYRNWRDPSIGHTGFVTFQKKHWFDEDITIQWFDWVLDVLFPGKKVGISMDMAPAHRSGRVAEHIKKREDEGHLVCLFIDGGLTSVLQVCDLAANKEIKSLIKKL